MPPMTREEMTAIALSFPGCEEGMSYGRPSFKVNGKFFTRLRAEDDSLVLLEVNHDEREMLMEAEPETFFFTAHYKAARAAGDQDAMNQILAAKDKRKEELA